jgi:hypothetical protein
MKQTVDALAAFGSASNLNSLANDNAKPLGEVDNSTNDYPSAKIHLILNLATTGMVVGGAVEIYFISKIEDNSVNADWSDGINPDDTNDVSNTIYNAQLIKTLRADDVMDSVDITWNCNDLSTLIGSDLPPYWTLVVFNKSGAAFVSSGHTAQYAHVSYQT